MILDVLKSKKAFEERRRIIEDENWQELVPKATVDLIAEVNGVERLKNLSVKEISDI